MTKLLYIPNGTYISWISYYSYGYSTKTYTYICEECPWQKGYTIDEVISELCIDNALSDLKLRNNMPINETLYYNEFEVIYD